MKRFAAMVIPALPVLCHAGPLNVWAVNLLKLKCPSQTLEFSAADLAPLGEGGMPEIHVKDAAGTRVSGIKRVTLDAGHQVDCYQNRLQPEKPITFAVAVGLKKVPGEIQERASEMGWLLKWEPMERNALKQGLAVILPPGKHAKHAEDSLNHLEITAPESVYSATWWAGFAWDKAGQFTSTDGWKQHVDEYHQALASPIQVQVAPGK